MEWIIVMGLFAAICYAFEQVIIQLNSNKAKNLQINTSNIYQKKSLMTSYEYSFYLKIKDLEAQYKIIPQLNLATIVDKNRTYKYRNELFRIVDFAIFNYDYSEILLLIEINDKTHYQKKRKERDKRVQNICERIGVPLIKFYTDKPNEKDYVLNRIVKEIEKVSIQKRNIK